MCVHSASACLADGLAIRHLRLAHVGRHAELAHHAVHDDFQVQFAHSGKNRLPGFGIGVHAERGIFLRQLLDRHAQLFLVGLGLRLHRELDHRRRESRSIRARSDGLRRRSCRRWRPSSGPPRRRYRPPGFPGCLRACWRACAAGGRRAPCGPWPRCRPIRRRSACPSKPGRTPAGPTYGSVMILKTSAANGSLSRRLAALASSPDRRCPVPSTGGISSGEGR